MDQIKDLKLQEPDTAQEMTNRKGKSERLIAFRIDAEMENKLSALTVATGKSRKALLVEACTDLYAKHFDEVKEYFDLS